MSSRLKSVIRPGSAGRGSRLPRWLAGVLAVLGFFLLTTAVEIGGTTVAEADTGCSCPAGYEVGTSGGVSYCFQPVPGGATVNCGSGTPAPGNPLDKLMPPRFIFIPAAVPGFGILFPTDGLDPSDATTASAIIGGLAGSGHLGMYVSPTGTDSMGGLGDGFGFSGKSVSISDTSGAFAGATAPGYHGSGGGGGIYGSVDLTPQLRAGGSFDYQRVSAGFDGGSSQGYDSYTFKGYSTYRWLQSFVTGSIMYDYVPTRFFDAATGGTGNFNSNLFDADISVGHVFALIDPRGAGSYAMVTKAPPQSSVIRNGLLLELSGHAGYVTGTSNGFTESTGFIWGNGNLQYGDLGIKAKLEGVIPANGVIWLPYVAGTVDQLVGYSNTLNIPTQAAIAADTLTFNQATTVWGAEIGVETQIRPGWKIGAKIFDSASSDFNMAGGTGYVKVQF
jgi:hypothetical protein